MHQPQACPMWLLTGVLLLSGLALVTATLEAQSTPEKTLTNSIGMEFVLIPAGTFTMGSDTGDQDERPVHQVTISKAFYMGKYEVTQGQWQAVMGTNPSALPGDANRPVDQVSWKEAQTFISKLNHRHPLFAWLSLFGVAFADFYIYLLASGAITDPTFF